MKKLTFNDLLQYVGKQTTPTVYSANKKTGRIRVLANPRITKPTQYYNICVGVDVPYLRFNVFPEKMNESKVQEIMFPNLGHSANSLTNNVLFLNKQDAIDFSIKIIKEKIKKEQQEINKLKAL